MSNVPFRERMSTEELAMAVASLSPMTTPREFVNQWTTEPRGSVALSKEADQIVEPAPVETSEPTTRRKMTQRQPKGRK